MIISNSLTLTNIKKSNHFFILVIFLVLPIIVCTQSKYPDWFLHPGIYPEYFVGYSIAGVLDAEDDAIWRYSFHGRGFLSGDATYFNNEDKWEKAYITEANAPTLKRNQITKAASIPTSLYGGGEEISLFRKSNSDFDELTHFPLEYPLNDPPKWVSRGPFYQDSNYYYGVGQYVLRGNENDAWRFAEERALIELASAVGLKVENKLTTRELRRSTRHEVENVETINILTYTFDHEFFDAKVMQRWIEYPKSADEQHLNTYIYVLMRIETGNIKHNLPSK